MFWSLCDTIGWCGVLVCLWIMCWQSIIHLSHWHPHQRVITWMTSGNCCFHSENATMYVPVLLVSIRGNIQDCHFDFLLSGFGPSQSFRGRNVWLSEGESFLTAIDSIRQAITDNTAPIAAWAPRAKFLSELVSRIHHFLVGPGNARDIVDWVGQEVALTRPVHTCLPMWRQGCAAHYFEQAPFLLVQREE
jgi:hypothetical protein